MMVQSVRSQSQKEESIQNFNHSHPYEYLTKLNNIYSGYNRSTGKDYSSASKIKLPFKKFNTMKVPQWFEVNYAKQKKQLIHYSTIDECRIDDSQKKLWKQHRQIIKKYLQEKSHKKVNINKNKNKQFAEKILSKDRNNIFLKKIIEKGTKFQYDQKKFQEEILEKLKNLNKNGTKKLTRCQTAKVMSQVKAVKIQESRFDSEKYKVSQRDFLEFNKQSDLIVKYKGMIKQVDCSISDKNIKKTAQLLKYMQKMVDDNQYI